MEKAYAIMFDNGAHYAEDSETCIYCICRTKERAEEIENELSEKLEKDQSIYFESLKNGDYEKAHGIRKSYVNIINYLVDMIDACFYIEECDFIE